MDEKDRGKLENKLNEIVDYFFEDREGLRKRISEFIIYFVENKITGSHNSKTGNEIFQLFAGRYPIATTIRTLTLLEKKGFLDRRTKMDGYYLSHSFMNKMEKFRGTWRDIIKQTEE